MSWNFAFEAKTRDEIIKGINANVSEWALPPAIAGALETVALAVSFPVATGVRIESKGHCGSDTAYGDFKITQIPQA